MTTQEPSDLAVELANLLGHGKGNPDILDCKTCEWHNVAGLIQSAIDKATEDLRADADKLRDALIHSDEAMMMFLDRIVEPTPSHITQFLAEGREYIKKAVGPYNVKYGAKK